MMHYSGTWGSDRVLRAYGKVSAQLSVFIATPQICRVRAYAVGLAYGTDPMTLGIQSVSTVHAADKDDWRRNEDVALKQS